MAISRLNYNLNIKYINMSVQGIPPGVSEAFLKKQVEIQRKLESDVAEIKKIEAGTISHPFA